MLRTLWYWLFPPLFALETEATCYDPSAEDVRKMTEKLSARIRSPDTVLLVVPPGTRLKKF